MVVTGEEEKMEKSVEWSGARAGGMVEVEERAGPPGTGKNGGDRGHPG